MSEEDNVAVDENTEVEEDTNIPESGEQEEATVPLEEFNKQRKANIELSGRIKLAEKKLKELEANPPVTSNLSSEDVEVSILKAQKTSNDEIAYLKKLAKVNGTSIIDAQSDEIYLGWKAKREAEEKSEKAKLGASKGSGSAKKEKEINSPNLTDEEHKALWNEQKDK